MYNIDHSWGQSWRSGTKCDCKIDWLWVRSTLEEIKYLLKFIFPFLRSGVEAKRGVEFCHSTRNFPKIRQKVGNTRFPLPTLLCAGYSVKLNFFFNIIHILIVTTIHNCHRPLICIVKYFIVTLCERNYFLFLVKAILRIESARNVLLHKHSTICSECGAGG